ncbi:MAG: acyl--CoA ligase [Phycisphaerales bacterium]|nr:MAG: acyl--CoA ligase [Phycisphaerales bacterium]
MQTAIEFQNLIELFNKSVDAVGQPDKLCLEILRTERHETLSFGQLRQGARAFALWLVGHGDIRIGDKAALLGKNRADWDVALWGIVLAGAVPVLIDPERPVAGVTNHLLHTDTRLLVMADDYQDEDARRELKEFAHRRGISLVEMGETPLGAREVAGPDDAEAEPVLDGISARVKPDDTAVILCTSGTTGDPREVELTHANLIANIQGSVEKIRLSHGDVLGHILPPHHSFGLTVGKMLALRAGAINIYTNKYRQISQIIRDRQVTIFIGIPALFTMLARKMEESLTAEKKKRPLLRLLDRYAPKLVGRGMVRKLGWQRLRFFLSGAAPMPKWVLNVLWKRGFLMYEGYGTTENSPVYGFNEDPRKLGSVGRPIRTLQVKIADGQNRTLPPGQRGEILLGGPCIMKGYYKNPKSTAAAVRTDEKGVRWLHTGDLGYLDDEGNLYITGRKKYLIVLPGGKNVNPELVETALSEARFVNEILLVPHLQKDPDGVVQETVRALVQPAWDVIETHTNLDRAELVEKPHVVKKLVWDSIHECQRKSRQLSHFEKISSHHVEIQIEEFQKTSTGKIRREAYIRL